jgi:hypothetical protein
MEGPLLRLLILNAFFFKLVLSFCGMAQHVVSEEVISTGSDKVLEAQWAEPVLRKLNTEPSIETW